MSVLTCFKGPDLWWNDSPICQWISLKFWFQIRNISSDSTSMVWHPLLQCRPHWTRIHSKVCDTERIHIVSELKTALQLSQKPWLVFRDMARNCQYSQRTNFYLFLPRMLQNLHIVDSNIAGSFSQSSSWMAMVEAQRTMVVMYLVNCSQRWVSWSSSFNHSIDISRRCCRYWSTGQ